MGTDQSTQAKAKNDAAEAERARQLEAERARQLEAERARQLEADRRRQEEELREERLQWEKQRLLEPHWKENQLREEQQRKEAERAWQRQEIERQQEVLRREEVQRQQELQRQQEFQHQQMLHHQELQRQQEFQRQLELQRQQEVQRHQLILQQREREQQWHKLQQQQLQTQPSPVQQVSAPPPVRGRSRSRKTGPASQTISPREKPKTANTAEPSLPRRGTSKDFVKSPKGWSIVDYMAEENSISKGLATKMQKLFDDENTVPFVARYRKAVTQGMNISQVRRIKNSYDYAKLVKQRAAAIKKEINDEGNWSAKLAAFINESKALANLDYIQYVHQVGRVITAVKSKNVSLGSMADSIIKGERVNALLQEVNPSVEGLKNLTQVKDRIVSMIADTISKDKRAFDITKKLESKYDLQIETKIKADQMTKKNMERYDSYTNFTSTVKNLAYDEYWTIIRGYHMHNALDIRIIIPSQFEKAFKNECAKLYEDAANVSPHHKELIEQAIERMYNRSIKPSISKRTLEEIYEKAETESAKMAGVAIKVNWSDETRHPALIGTGPSEEHIEEILRDHLDMFRKENTATRFREVIMDVVSYLGVDLNKTTPTHLKWLPGLDEEKAKNIVDWKKSFGAFVDRNDLKRVKGIDDKTFQQCAGFVRVMPATAVGNDGRRISPSAFNYLDQTSIHPELYAVAEAFLKDAKCKANQLGNKAFRFAVKLHADQGAANIAKKLRVSKEVVEVIIRGLLMEEEESATEASDDVAAEPEPKRRFDDLTIGTVLNGVITNVTRHGAFVDVGVERDGLIIPRYMGGMTVSIGQQVETEVNTIEKDRRRFGLTLRRCL